MPLMLAHNCNQPRLAVHLQRFLDVARRAFAEPSPATGKAPRGLLLSGPPGCGKARLARQVARQCGVGVLVLDSIEILDQFFTDGAQRLSDAFEEARRQSPCILLLRDVDALAPRNALDGSSPQMPLTARLLAELGRLGNGAHVLVAGSTAHPNRVAPELRQPGRLDREIVVPVPDREARREILMRRAAQQEAEANLDFDPLARITTGMTGSDLESICLEASLAAERRNPDKPVLRKEDFLAALLVVEPTSASELCVETPCIRWDQVGGLEEPKRRLRELVEWPLKHAELFASAGITAGPCVLLRGPRGSGKTLLARALARESGAAFLSLRGNVFRTLHPDPAATLREAFRRARHAAPCILFLDDLDTLLGRDLIQPFLAEMADSSRLRGVAVLAATSRPEHLDPLLFAPGLFAEIIELPHPDAAGRRAILQLHLADPPAATQLDLELIARQTDGATGADLSSLCQRAIRAALYRVIEWDPQGQVEVRQSDFQAALDEFRQRPKRHFE